MSKIINSFPWQTGTLPTVDGQLIIAEMDFGPYDFVTKLDIYRTFVYVAPFATWWSLNNRWKARELQASIKRWAIVEE
jgi:hypothetical protein